MDKDKRYRVIFNSPAQHIYIIFSSFDHFKHRTLTVSLFIDCVLFCFSFDANVLNQFSLNFIMSVASYIIGGFSIRYQGRNDFRATSIPLLRKDVYQGLHFI